MVECIKNYIMLVVILICVGVSHVDRKEYINSLNKTTETYIESMKTINQRLENIELILNDEFRNNSTNS